MIVLCDNTGCVCVVQNMSRSYSSVTLSTIYPKRTFTDADMSQTLLDLELAPSGILVVVPVVNTHLLLQQQNCVICTVVVISCGILRRHIGKMVNQISVCDYCLVSTIPLPFFHCRFTVPVSRWHVCTPLPLPQPYALDHRHR